MVRRRFLLKNQCNAQCSLPHSENICDRENLARPLLMAWCCHNRDAPRMNAGNSFESRMKKPTLLIAGSL